MIPRRILQAGWLLLGMTAAGVAAPAAGPTRAQLGREVKFRILVDKVMQPERGWTTEEWMVRETARKSGAGF